MQLSCFKRSGKAEGCTAMSKCRCEAIQGGIVTQPYNLIVAPKRNTSNKRKNTDEDVRRFRAVPGWAIDLVRGVEGTDICFVAVKTIENSDLVRQQNRFYLPIDFVKANLVPMLSEPERAAASLLDDGRKRSRTSRIDEELGGEERKTKTVGGERRGLPVTVFTRSRFRCYLKLTRWDGSGGTVIKGKEFKLFKAWSSLKSGDEVETWAFRLHRGGDLCFAIGGGSSASSSSC